MMFIFITAVSSIPHYPARLSAVLLAFFCKSAIAIGESGITALLYVSGLFMCLVFYCAKIRDYFVQKCVVNRKYCQAWIQYKNPNIQIGTELPMAYSMLSFTK